MKLLIAIFCAIALLGTIIFFAVVVRGSAGRKQRNCEHRWIHLGQEDYLCIKCGKRHP